jgi:hypothetical protein
LVAGFFGEYFGEVGGIPELTSRFFDVGGKNKINFFLQFVIFLRRRIREPSNKKTLA